MHKVSSQISQCSPNRPIRDNNFGQNWIFLDSTSLPGMTRYAHALNPVFPE